jgi:hypothetical protein
MKFDFSNVDDVQSYVSVPAGTHVCRVTEVRPGVARDGSARWTYRLEVVGGVHHGRTAAWDSLTWSDRGVGRVRHVLKGLGVPTHGVVEIEPQDLVGRRAQVQVQLEERENPQTGRREVRTRVPYAGYEPVEGAQGEDEHAAHGHAAVHPSKEDCVGHECTAQHFGMQASRQAANDLRQSCDGRLDARGSDVHAGRDFSRFLSNSSAREDECELDAALEANSAHAMNTDSERQSNVNAVHDLDFARPMDGQVGVGSPQSCFGRAIAGAYDSTDRAGMTPRAQLVSESSQFAGGCGGSAWMSDHQVLRSSDLDTVSDLGTASSSDGIGWNHDPAVCAPAPGDPIDGQGAKSGDGDSDSCGVLSTAGAEGFAVPVKRRPGRPRKHPLPVGQPPSSVGTRSAGTQPAGTPPASALPAGTQPAGSQTTGAAPKRRGRKPKHQGPA